MVLLNKNFYIVQHDVGKIRQKLYSYSLKFTYDPKLYRAFLNMDVIEIFLILVGLEKNECYQIY
jgi:hypothetical protein